VELQDPWSVTPSAGHAPDEIKLGDRYASHLQRGMFDLVFCTCIAQAT
jgi:hypothetical protein